MTGDPTPDASETDAEVSRRPTAGAAELGTDIDRETAVRGVGAVALLAVAVETTLSILANVPFDPVVASPPVRTAAGVLAVGAVVAALVTLAVVDERATVRVGSLFAAVFGVLPLVAPATILPALVAVVGGSALVLAGTLGVPAEWTYRGVRRRAIAGGFVAALAVTLVGVTGLVEGLRSAGAFVTLAAVAAVGTQAEGSRVAAVAGLLALFAVVAAGAVSPFVVGSTLLVAFAVTGVPHLLAALAVAGAVAAAVAGLRRGAYGLAVGAVLVLLAGVPATFPRALTLLLGATLVLLDVPGARTEVAG